MITAHTHHVTIRPSRKTGDARITVEPNRPQYEPFTPTREPAQITTTEHINALDTAIAISRIAGMLAIVDLRPDGSHHRTAAARVDHAIYDCYKTPEIYDVKTVCHNRDPFTRNPKPAAHTKEN